MARISVPAKGRLRSTLRVDGSNKLAQKYLTRLSREALISLALNWLDPGAIQNASPYLRASRGEEEGEEEDEDEDMDDLYPPLRTVEDLQQFYADMRSQKGSKRDVVSRILEGDWRHGLTLYQLAMADFAYLDEHPSSLKWSAYQILPLRQPTRSSPDEEEVLKVDKESLHIPRFHPSTFLQNLQDQALPDVKAHYLFYRLESLPVLLLRIFVIDSPYNSTMALSSLDQTGTTANFEASNTVFIAFPDGAASIYISKSLSSGPSGHGESRSLQALIVDGVPKALSRPRERYAVKQTNLISRNLEALLDKRGAGRGNHASGGWSIYADEKSKMSPLDSIIPIRPFSASEGVDKDAERKRKSSGFTLAQQQAKKARKAAEARFGQSARINDGKGIEKLEVVLQDPFPAAEDEDASDEDGDAGATQAASRRKSKVDTLMREADIANDEMDIDGDDSATWTPMVKITFTGPHVFAGIRQLVEAGIVDGDRLPGWMTGEDAVTRGVVKNGRIRGA
jgi:central kinetochore subunit Mis15/CHL4